MTIYGQRINTFEIKQGDLLPVLSTVLTDGFGDAVDLSSASLVELTMKLCRYPHTKVLDGVAVTFDPDGTVTYEWQTGDTDTKGMYDIEWVAYFPAGKPSSYPSKGFDHVEVTRDLT